jgi:hypothetical protein
MVLGLALTLASACQKQPEGQKAAPASAPPVEKYANTKTELEWARAALERNPSIRVVGVDASTNSIKAVVKSTGDAVQFTPGELAAIPIGELVVLTQKHEAAVKEVPIATANESQANAANVAISNDVATSRPPVPGALDNPAYKVERKDGALRITGPGVSIESQKSRTSTNVAPTAGTDDPFVCDGKRLVHFDGRHLNVNGDAIVARGGCTLHITNSEITASGTALVVEGATVYVTNSKITGRSGSLDIAPEATLILRNSQFTGVARRDKQATIQDQGGNTWR